MWYQQQLVLTRMRVSKRLKGGAEGQKLVIIKYEIYINNLFQYFYLSNKRTLFKKQISSYLPVLWIGWIFQPTCLLEVKVNQFICDLVSDGVD